MNVVIQNVGDAYDGSWPLKPARLEDHEPQVFEKVVNSRGIVDLRDDNDPRVRAAWAVIALRRAGRFANTDKLRIAAYHDPDSIRLLRGTR